MAGILNFLSAGIDGEGKLLISRQEVRLDVQHARKALPQGYRGKEVYPYRPLCQEFSYLPDAE